MIRKALILPDLHFPSHDKRTLKAVESYMADNHWDELIYLGDVLDFDCISSHNKGKPGITAGKSVQADYDYVNKVFDRHRKIVGDDCKITFIEGNHDYRIERFIEENPTLKGSLEVAKGLRLKERKINWVRFWSTGATYRVGKATFIHGRYVTDSHAKKHVQAYGTNVFYGHCHDLQSYSLTHAGSIKSMIGQSCGCLCELRQYWAKGYPNRWNQAFATFNFFPDGLFTYHVTPIFNHRFISPDDMLYQG